MKNPLYILLFYFIISCSIGKNDSNKEPLLRSELQLHLNKLATEGRVSYEFYDTIALNFLRDSCTNQELLSLMNRKNPYFRIAAYLSMKEKNDPNLYHILFNHLNDTAKVMWKFADDAFADIMVSDILINNTKWSLTRSQKDSLVAEVLNYHPYLETSLRMIQQIEPNEKFYSIIRKRAETRKLYPYENLYYICALAKFKKETDIPLLRENFQDYSNIGSGFIFTAIEDFPDSSFFPFLFKYFQYNNYVNITSDNLEQYCRSVAVYKNETSLKILSTIIKKTNRIDGLFLNSNKEYVFKAIHKYYDPIYEKLYKQLKPQMSEYVINYLDKPDLAEFERW